MRLPAAPWLPSWACLRKGAFVVCSHWAHEPSLGQGQTVSYKGLGPRVHRGREMELMKVNFMDKGWGARYG